MSVYQATSIKEVLGRIIRSSSLKNAELISRMDEWIPEAMGYMHTRHSFVKRWQLVRVRFHRGKLPCDLSHILAVEWNGYRVPVSRSTRAFNAPVPVPSSTNDLTLFGTLLTQRAGNIEEGGYITETQLYALNGLPESSGVFYYWELGSLTFSLCDANVIVHYKALPTDDEGFPLIPDNEDFKQAIYWYCRGQLIGAGFKDVVFTYRDCEERFEKHAARAKGEISYPSVDEMDATLQLNDRFLLPENWANSFFTPPAREGQLG